MVNTDQHVTCGHKHGWFLHIILTSYRRYISIWLVIYWNLRRAHRKQIKCDWASIWVLSSYSWGWEIVFFSLTTGCLRSGISVQLTSTKNKRKQKYVKLTNKSKQEYCANFKSKTKYNYYQCVHDKKNVFVITILEVYYFLPTWV